MNHPQGFKERKTDCRYFVLTSNEAFNEKKKKKKGEKGNKENKRKIKVIERKFD